jgi:hypothetical protein
MDGEGQGRPCALGAGDFPCARFVEALAAGGFSGSVVYEWDRLWLPDLDPPESVLPDGAKAIFDWAGVSHAATTTRR